MARSGHRPCWCTNCAGAIELPDRRRAQHISTALLHPNAPRNVRGQQPRPNADTSDSDRSDMDAVQDGEHAEPGQKRARSHGPGSPSPGMPQTDGSDDGSHHGSDDGLDDGSDDGSDEGRDAGSDGTRNTSTSDESGWDDDDDSEDENGDQSAFQRFSDAECVWPPREDAAPEAIALGYMVMLALRKGQQQLSKGDMETEIKFDREIAEGAAYMSYVPKKWDTIRRSEFTCSIHSLTFSLGA